MKISILGCGVFGSAIATRLSLKGHIIIEEEIGDSEIILVAVPSYAVSDVLLSHKSKIINQRIIICSKGFDKNGDLLSLVLEKEFPENSIYFLYGPTLAEELRSGYFSIMVLAGGKDKEILKKEIELENFRIELSDDVVGVQIGAALKNVVAIFIGLVEGAGLGENTQAFICSKGLQEIHQIGIKLGAKTDTFLGFACAGDLFLRSRNRILGIEIGKGRTLEEATEEMIYPNEGIASLKNILKMEKTLGLNLIFFRLLYSVVFEKMPTKEAVKRLMENI